MRRKFRGTTHVRRGGALKGLSTSCLNAATRTDLQPFAWFHPVGSEAIPVGTSCHALAPPAHSLRHSVPRLFVTAIHEYCITSFAVCQDRNRIFSCLRLDFRSILRGLLSVYRNFIRLAAECHAAEIAVLPYRHGSEIVPDDSDRPCFFGASRHLHANRTVFDYRAG